MKIKDIWPEVVEQLIERGLAKDWIHGIPHIERVRRNLEILLNTSELNERIIECLKIAIDVHDIGRGLPGNHAQKSAEIFSKMAIEDISQEEFENILFAVKNHSTGLEGLGIQTAKEDKEILLGLLCLVDHMDLLGNIGFYQIIDFKDTSLLSHQFSSAELQDFIENPKKISIDMINMKEDSILAELVYEYCVTPRIVKPVKKYLSQDFFLVAILDRRRELLAKIQELLEIQSGLESERK